MLVISTSVQNQCWMSKIIDVKSIFYNSDNE